MPRRSFALLTMAAALGIAHPALGQPAPMPCNALCRAYMGSHYTPPGEPASEPSATSGVPEADESSASVQVMPQPPRRPVQAGLPAAQRFAVLPPPRPGIGTRDATAVRPDPIVPAPDAPAAIEHPVAEPVAIPGEAAPADAAPIPAEPIADTIAPPAPSVLPPVPEPEPVREPEPKQRSLLE